MIWAHVTMPWRGDPMRVAMRWNPFKDSWGLGVGESAKSAVGIPTSKGGKVPPVPEVEEKPEEPVAPPTRSDAETQSLATQQRRRFFRRKGLQSNLLSGPGGLLESGSAYVSSMLGGAGRRI